MKNEDAAYEASITAVPYAARVVPHLVRYLEDSLADAIEQRALVHGSSNDVDSGPDFDAITVRLRFYAPDDDTAAEIARLASGAIGEHDEHWRVTGRTVTRVGAA